jgi:BirA family biotin operon repressor/biotin-[acetyl-CoA-carboxylase] ligase
MRFLKPDEIRASTFVRHVEIYDLLGSTNDRAAELARETNIELPALVVARHQTAGRGRGQNKWWSADGALTFSILLDSAESGIPTANWPQLSLATAVAVCNALEIELDTGRIRAESEEIPTARGDGPTRSIPRTRLGIKWPNDVLLDGRKVCGILIESPGGTGPAKKRLIFGVGINVNNSWRDAPDKIDPGGTAMCDVTGREHELQDVLVLFLQAFERRLVQLGNGHAELSAAWRQLVGQVHHDVEIDANGRRVAGRCLGVAEDGALVIRTGPQTRRIYGGSVRIA